MMRTIAIIGAGLSGVTLANTLKQQVEVTLFEKSYSSGGRVASRASAPFSFDHGAQYFKAKSKPFNDLVDMLLAKNFIAPWQARFVEMSDQGITKQNQWDATHPHYVGIPNNRAFVEHLSRALSISLNTPVASIEKVNQQWALKKTDGSLLGLFDWVVCAMPVKQTQDILATANLHYDAIADIQMQACYALMLGFDQAIDLGFDAAMVKDETVSWISNNSSKPMRDKGFSVLINSTNDWADSHIEKSDDWVIDKLMSATNKLIHQDLSNATYCELKRWKYANCKRQLEKHYLLDPANNIGLCGDWFISGRVESAFLSGYYLAHAMLEKNNV
jgi:renalase